MRINFKVESEDEPAFLPLDKSIIDTVYLGALAARGTQSRKK